MQFEEVRIIFDRIRNGDPDPEAVRLRALYEEVKPIIEDYISLVRDLSTTGSDPLS